MKNNWIKTLGGHLPLISYAISISDSLSIDVTFSLFNLHLFHPWDWDILFCPFTKVKIPTSPSLSLTTHSLLFSHRNIYISLSFWNRRYFVFLLGFCASFSWRKLISSPLSIQSLMHRQRGSDKFEVIVLFFAQFIVLM